MSKLLEEIKADAKVYIDANIWDGEDRSGCTSDFASFSPDDLQEVIDDMLDDIIVDRCKDAAIKAILNQPARNMTRRQAMQAVNKALSNDRQG